MIPRLDTKRVAFPDPETACSEPDGLLAWGGALDQRFMVAAYANAIFPWFSDDEPILWWSPSQRAIIEPAEVNITKSMSKTLRNKPWTVKLDHDFNAMVELCSDLKRTVQNGTWIGQAMKGAYSDLHANGLAHSVEVYYEGQFCGGLFGVKLGGMFYGESMASLRQDASKVALAALCLGAQELGVDLIDCQMMTDHLKSMGAKPIERQELRRRISGLVLNTKPESWADLWPESFDFTKALGTRKAFEPVDVQGLKRVRRLRH